MTLETCPPAPAPVTRGALLDQKSPQLAGRARALTCAPQQGPQFGSYRAEEVTWLLKDLSDVALEADIASREADIQAGRAHYAESLPVEYQPSAQYQRLYEAALNRSARRVAHAVGFVTEQVLAARGADPVLVSLARAGTPVGILMRRWAAAVHGRRLPHYAISIVRGRGIDVNALAYIASRHDPTTAMFVDGWTGKGAITRELLSAVEDANALLGTSFPSDIAVLADTGRCVRFFGTRDDFLIPSACLNSTVSGLVSRTVLNDALIGEHDFHGAKQYRDLAAVDQSAAFLDAVSVHFDTDLVDEVSRQRDRRGDGRQHRGRQHDGVRPDWSGWAAVEQVAADHGIENINLVKPGVGETTRVLLRRVPWKVLVRPDRLDELQHVLLLAEQRGVPVVPVDGLAYSCIGLIEPKGTDQ